MWPCQLADLLMSSYRSFLEEWHSIARELIGWDAENPAAARAGNVAHYLLEGMAYGRLGGQLRDDEIDEMVAILARAIREIGAAHGLSAKEPAAV